MRRRGALTRSSSGSLVALGGSMAPSTVVLLNTPLILLPILLMPKDSPRLDRFLAETEAGAGQAPASPPLGYGWEQR